MRERARRGRIWWWLFLILLVVAGILTGYFLGRESSREEREVVTGEKAPGKKKEILQVEGESPVEAEDETIITQEVEEVNEAELPDAEDYCSQTENDVLEFFIYLNKKNYIQHLEPGIDTFVRFKRLIRALSARPPIPAEGIDPKTMTRNIFHFFRRLDNIDIRLIREIIRNEADTLEMNLDLFYRWLMLGDRCPDREGVRPSPDVTYQYAGFFMNTIGGRAYLFRRTFELRLLISYYCLLVIYEADKSGGNNYGIDIFPLILQLKDEIGLYNKFHFQNEYTHQLNLLEGYYLKKR